MQHSNLRASACWSEGAFVAFVLLLAASLPTAAAAQQLEGYGVRGGLSLASIRGGTFVGVQAGATVGVYGRFRLGDALGGRFSFQPELVYVRKGVNGEEDTIEDTVPLGSFDPVGEVAVGISEVAADVKATIDFIEVPLLIRYALPVGERFAPSLYAGPYVGLGFNRTAEVAVKGTLELRNAALEALAPPGLLRRSYDSFRSIDELLDEFNGSIEQINVFFPDANLAPIENPIEASDLLENVDYGLTLGADLGFGSGTLGRRRVVVGVRYDLGLRELTQQDAEAVQAIQALVTSIDDFRDTDGFEGKSSTLTVTLGVALR